MPSRRSKKNEKKRYTIFTLRALYFLEKWTVLFSHCMQGMWQKFSEVGRNIILPDKGEGGIRGYDFDRREVS